MIWMLGCGAGETPAARVLVNEVSVGSAEGDWVELYNPGHVEEDSIGWSLVDADRSPPWSLPEASLPAGGFVAVYLDGGSDGLHAPFRLDYRGGVILLFDAGGRLHDEARHSLVHDGASWARIPDGGDDWGEMAPTPGAPNRNQRGGRSARIAFERVTLPGDEAGGSAPGGQ